jgi:DNA-binding transcriptional ArsR family regulator
MYSAKILPAVIALLSGGASLYLTVRLCLSVGDTSTWHAAAVAVVLGVAVELAKTNYLPMGLEKVKSGEALRSLGGLWLTCLSMLLVGLSLAASLAYLQRKDASEDLSRARDSRMMAEYSQRLMQIDVDMERAREQSRRLTELNVITRGNFVEERMERLAGERMELVSKIKDLENPGADTLIGSGTAGEGKPVSDKRPTLFGFDWRTAINGLIALVLELMTATSLVVLGAGRRGTKSGTKGEDAGKPSKDVGTKAIEEELVAEKELTELPPLAVPSNVNRYMEVRSAVIRGDVEPKIRELKEYFGIGQGTASRHLRRLLAEGVVAQRGRGYVLRKGVG